ncbi:type I phosphomannose isomerase catalytic subunit [Ktedonosporobacter rubrisoli]|uniref:type I phosphomannose isomerase catalytic subunit n=1 Tax=Ktedonosporobacter rubrisoli TaxID=2509675 RepID=UPI0013EED0AE|nr:type I phosphomannose isomerase catalytic subunit [Ktedonosporobacter rubrisoli]
MQYLYPIRLEASLHETIWGGRHLEQGGWKQLPAGNVAIGESWETEVSNIVQNGLYAGKTLGDLVTEMGPALLGPQAMLVFGQRFPLLAKFLDANAQLSVQVHPEDGYAAKHENGKLGKTEFWYILSAEPGATIVHGFETATTRADVQSAIENVNLDQLLHEEPVQAGDVIFVPAGTVHAIGSGVLLYELQEYSDVTYRMYDYGRLTASGKPRELHIERSLDVARFDVSPQIKMHPVTLPAASGYEDRCLVASRYFLTREMSFKEGTTLDDKTSESCIIISSLGAELEVSYGPALEQRESLARGQTMVLPAALGTYRLEGCGVFLYSYVPDASDEAWQLWLKSNQESVQR